MSEQTKVPPRLADEASYHVDPGRGWVLFSGVMLGLIGVLNLVFGIGAVSDATFLVRDVEVVITDLRNWGWFFIVIGAVQLAVAVGIFMNSDLARWVGVCFAGANLIVQFFVLVVLAVHPGWAIMVIFIDIIVIFGLMNYGGSDRRALH
jgi:hypothetical protein